MPATTLQNSKALRRARAAWQTGLLVCALFVSMSMSAPAAAQGKAPSLQLPQHWTPATLPDSLSFDMQSRYTGQNYRILIGLPHEAPPAGGYPVLWALDGLASFPLMALARPRPGTKNQSEQWRKKKGELAPGLIVAIGYASGEVMDVNARAKDYTPTPLGKTGDSFSPEHGGADAFLRFLNEELRPEIARHFPMDPRRHTLFGFSYGGLFTLYTLSREPQHFQRYWAASPSLWFGEHQMMKALPQLAQRRDALAQVDAVHITVGRDEQYPASHATQELKQRLQARTMVDNAQRFARELSQAGAGKLSVEFENPADHDHQDMLMHGARRVIAFAFANGSKAGD